MPFLLLHAFLGTIKWNRCNQLLNIWITVEIMSAQLALYTSVSLWFFYCVAFAGPYCYMTKFLKWYLLYTSYIDYIDRPIMTDLCHLPNQFIQTYKTHWEPFNSHRWPTCNFSLLMRILELIRKKFLSSWCDTKFS